MGRPYTNEVEALSETYAWSRSQDVQNLVKLVANSCGTVIAVGSGGSLAAAQVLSSLFRHYRQQLAFALTPLEIEASPITGSHLCFWLCTASGRNVDIRRALKTVGDDETTAVNILCASVDSPLEIMARKIGISTTFSFGLPRGKDGFLATNTLFATTLLVVRAFRALSGQRRLPKTLSSLLKASGFSKPRMDALEASVRNNCRNSDYVVILFGPSSKAAAVDLESKLSAAAEPYKFAMRRVRHFAAAGPFDEYFRACDQASIALAPRSTPAPKPVLGAFDMVSAGAISQAALYALSRIPGVAADARVIEHDTNELTNINRYALLRRSGVRSDMQKAQYLSRLNLDGLEIQPIPLRYEALNRARIGPLARNVLIGVDNLHSRWAVQEEHPEWLGIGATEDYLAFLTVHHSGLPCARCVHPEGPLADGPAASAAFVSHWGGLVLAAAFARARSWSDFSADEQVTQFASLQLGSSGSVWKTKGAARGDCPNGCVSHA